MLDKVMRKLGLRPEEAHRTEGEAIHEREADARANMLDGRAMAPDGGLIDFEGDLERPPSEDPAS